MGCVNSNPKPNTKDIPNNPNPKTTTSPNPPPPINIPSTGLQSSNQPLPNINSNYGVPQSNNINSAVRQQQKIPSQINPPINSYNSNIATNAQIPPYSQYIGEHNNAAGSNIQQKQFPSNIQQKQFASNINSSQNGYKLNGDSNEYNYAGNSSIKKSQYQQAHGAGGYSSMEKKGNLDYSKRQTVLDDVGYVPEDSVMDFGQTTIDDLNKVEVNFHV